MPQNLNDIRLGGKASSSVGGAAFCKFIMLHVQHFFMSLCTLVKNQVVLSLHSASELGCVVGSKAE